MDLLMGIVTILVIAVIVAVGGGLVTFLVYMVVGAFDKDRTTNTTNSELLDYSQYKQLENVQENAHEYDFEAINEAKVEQEKKLADETNADKEDSFKLLDDEDVNPEEMEKILVEEQKVEKGETKTEQVAETEEVEDDADDFELDNLLDEISNETEEEVKSEMEEEVKAGDELGSYSIDEFLSQAEAEAEKMEEAEKIEEKETAEETEPVQDNKVEEISKITEELEEEIVEPVELEQEVETEPAQETEQEPELGLAQEAEVKPEIETEPEQEVEALEETETIETEEEKEPVVDTASQQEIERLRAQVAELNQKLSQTENKTVTTNVVYTTVDMTEEECLNRLAVLEERLKVAKKDYRINLKEYRPLKKIMNELERNQIKLRRKDAVVAKQKIALYGVNNYVDIDKEKAQKLANELELLDGLRLSVQHCEEVIAANKDRYPILEHTNDILEEQIANLESDIEATKIMLEKIRDKEGKGGNK